MKRHLFLDCVCPIFLGVTVKQHRINKYAIVCFRNGFVAYEILAVQGFKKTERKGGGACMSSQEAPQSQRTEVKDAF